MVRNLMWCALMVLQANIYSVNSWIGLCDSRLWWEKYGWVLKYQMLDCCGVIVHLCVSACAAESTQAAGRSHPGWRDLGDAAEGHRV